MQLLTASVNGKTVLEGQRGMDISKNPYQTFRLKDAKIGDIVSNTWHDHSGEAVTKQIAVTQA